MLVSSSDSYLDKLNRSTNSEIAMLSNLNSLKLEMMYLRVFYILSHNKNKNKKIGRELCVSIVASHVNITKLLLSGCPTSTLEVYNTVGEPDYQTAHVCV